MHLTFTRRVFAGVFLHACVNDQHFGCRLNTCSKAKITTNQLNYSSYCVLIRVTRAFYAFGQVLHAHTHSCMHILHVDVCVHVCVCARAYVATDGSLNNLASLDACGVGMQMWRVTLFLGPNRDRTLVIIGCVLTRLLGFIYKK